MQANGRNTGDQRMQLWRQPPNTPPDHPSRRFSSHESNLFDYFRTVCAREFSLYFESPIWEGLVLQIAQREAFACHAALAISAWSRTHYVPSEGWFHTQRGALSIRRYSLVQYGKAVTELNRRLCATPECIELALIGCVLFVNLEFLQGRSHDFGTADDGCPNQAYVHIQGALGILQQRRLHGDELPRDWQHFYDAVCYMQEQLRYRSNSVSFD